MLVHPGDILCVILFGDRGEIELSGERIAGGNQFEQRERSCAVEACVHLVTRERCAGKRVGQLVAYGGIATGSHCWHFGRPVAGKFLSCRTESNIGRGLIAEGRALERTKPEGLVLNQRAAQAETILIALESICRPVARPGCPETRLRRHFSDIQRRYRESSSIRPL